MEQQGLERKGLEYLGRGASPSLQGRVKEYLDIAIRRKWLILSIAVLSTAIAGTYAWIKKDLYRSSTVILVEQQTIPEKYVSSVVDDVASRVSTITQQVLSRTSLVKVIEEFGLFRDLIEKKGYEPAILMMRDRIRVETKGNRGRIEAFTISFAHEDPTTAMKVTSKLASQYIEENLKLREQFVEGASEFLESELQAAREELQAKERTLSEFKKRYMGELPSQLESNLRALDRLQEEKTSTQESINTLTNRLMLIEKAIHEYETSGAVSADAEITGGGEKSGRPPADPQIALLKQLEQDLIRLSAEYTDAYPDVIVLKKQIKQLKAELAEKYAVSEDEVSQPESIRIFDPYLKGLLQDRDELKLQIAALEQRMQTITKAMEELQGRVERTAAREQELLSLERDYASMQKNYQSLLAKRLNARISENLEKRQKGERFRILDPANLPTTPEGPNRWMIVLGGLVVGCALGYGVAFGLDQWNPTFRRSEEAEVSLGFPILATIPSFQLAYGKSSEALLSGPLSNHDGQDADEEDDDEDGGLLSKIQRSGKSKVEGGKNVSLVAKWRPSSIVAEQFRVAATRLVLMSEERANTIVLATSAMKGEGKTSSVANLGYTLARDLEKQTLVIGCDFKSPRLHEMLAVSSVPGLADYLHGNVDLEHCLHRLEEVPLWVLPAGSVGDHVVSLSRLPQLGSLLESLRPRFDFILLDAPPILPLADMNVLSGMADVLILVVRAGVTPQEIVIRALDMLRPTVQARILLTDASSFGMPYFVPHVYGSPYATREQV
ncbi:MAG: hypothetical protein D6704_08360 [Nitrospirae bacterium]|nr:MAG: hypothetical protein D6704_08360 [Nitrospirota bacterium]